MTLGKVLTMALMGVALTGIEAAAQVPTVWVIGDYTASNVDRRGWADPFGGHCQPRGWRYAIAPLKDLSRFRPVPGEILRQFPRRGGDRCSPVPRVPARGGTHSPCADRHQSATRASP